MLFFESYFLLNADHNTGFWDWFWVSSELFLSYFTSAGRGRPHEWNNEKITKNSHEKPVLEIWFSYFTGLVITRVLLASISRLFTFVIVVWHSKFPHFFTHKIWNSKKWEWRNSKLREKEPPHTITHKPVIVTSDITATQNHTQTGYSH